MQHAPYATRAQERRPRAQALIQSISATRNITPITSFLWIMKRRSTLSFSSKISQRPYGKRPQARLTISQPLGNTCREHAKGLVQFEMKILQGGPTRVLRNSSLVNELRQRTHPCVHVEIGKDRGRITRLVGSGRRYQDPVQGRLEVSLGSCAI